MLDKICKNSIEKPSIKSKLSITKTNFAVSAKAVNILLKILKVRFY